MDIRTLILNQGSADEMREQVRQYYQSTFHLEEQIYASLVRDEAFYLRADPLRHPIIFYLGHTAAFFINKLIVAKLISARVNPEYESMFAIGVDEMSWDDLNMAHYNWPPVPEVRAYREQVRAVVESLISSLPLEMPITWDSPWWAIVMGIEHTHIHIETSSVLICQLPISEVRALDSWPVCPESGDVPPNELLPVQGGILELGKSHNDPLYGWDNEYGSYRAEVQNFRAAKFLVSNAEFLGFVKAGGYEEHEYWTEEGWAWKTFRRATHPTFWVPQPDGSFALRTMAAVIALPWDHPVEVNYLEAKAFCNWKAKVSGKPIRLPTEEEWYCLRDTYLNTDLPYWETAPANINLEYWASTCPVTKFRMGDFFDLIGNVWQWTETPIFAYPGFKVHPFYDDFSTPTFDNRHNMIKGGSWISTGNEAIRDARYAFRRHFFQHAGFRYVESSAPLTVHAELYESDPSVIPWCDANWGKQENYSTEIMRQILPHLSVIDPDKALVLGCKTGRTCFELAKLFTGVTGVDITARLIKVATAMQEKGYIRYVRDDEAEIQTYIEPRLADFGLDTVADRVEFWQADASNLLSKFTDYNLILAENVLEHSTNPVRFLQMIPNRIKSGGLLIIADAYDWQTEFTNRELWLGGFRKDGEPYSSFEGLRDILSPCFELLALTEDVEQLLRRNERNYSLKRLQLSIWRKF